MNKEYSEAIVDVLNILQHTEVNLVKKIPQKLIEFWRKNASETYVSKFDCNKKIEEIEFTPKAKAIIGMIYRNYWCSSDERKEYDEILKKNEEKFQKENREKYNPDNIFKDNNINSSFSDKNLNLENKITEVNSILIKDNEKFKKTNSNIIEYKENIFQKIINKIKSIFE